MRSGRNTDSGWAWVVLAVSVFNMYVLGTLAISVGMFQDRFLQHYDGSTAYISLVCSFFISLQSILVQYTYIHNDWGTILSVGLVASSITNTLPQLLGCFGILSGIGFGIIYTPATIAVGYYFREKRVLAHGLATSFIGVGVLSGPHVIGWLIDQFGWRTAMSTLGCVIAQMVVTGSLIFPHERSKQSASVAVGKYVSAFTLLKDKILLIILLNYFTYMMGYSIQLVHLPSYVRSVGVPPAKVPSLFTAYGLTLTVARILIGAICNDKSTDLLMMYISCQGLNSLTILFMPLFAYGFAQLVLYEVLFGLYYGVSFMLLTPIVVELFGVERLATVFGVTLCVGGVSYLIGPTIAGALYDMTSSYAAGFHIGGSVSLLGTMLLFLIPILKREAKVPGDPENPECLDPS
ncbi:monocarboxylate transporter 12-like [Haliotis rubra]|uniref:monocarboxylate transporter 12-like n=1 Tax=Haliotis rubra TaxID=36100 RepID=UPI001EE5E4AA|nr:monocarboxylate transporter 12-like [Haliotis rubra]